ncbi:MAG TPA: hypothetical protein VFY39_17040 [Gammaproteobacteria bacterium]|nr:hypothetical protein [Gammaproteobacteria bacterium]
MLERRAFEPASALHRARNLDAADEAVEAFWRHYRRRGEPAREAVEQLTAQALAADPGLADHGTQRLFGGVVEPLCDAFSACGAETYARVFTQVIMAARSYPQCTALDAALEARSIFSERDLLAASTARIETPGGAGAGGAPAALNPVRSITVLSRLTLGADVALVLPLLARLRRQFPGAALRFTGAEGAKRLVRGIPGIEHISAPYGRTDTLQARLNAWPALCAAIAGSFADDKGLDLVIDPDSRLTQLGLLPPVPASRYYRFPSRTYGGEGTRALSELIGDWLDASFGPGEATLPVLELGADVARFKSVLRAALLKTLPKRIVSASFGVGGNERKRIGVELEADLLEWIVECGSRVLLARGTGLSELTQNARLCRRLEHRGLSVLHLPRGRRLDSLEGSDADVVTWEADLGAFLAAVGCADMYLGYDSAGQHIAAALGVPTLSLFVESAGPRHGARWMPRGPAPIRVVRSSWPPDARRMLSAARSAFMALSQ